MEIQGQLLSTVGSGIMLYGDTHDANYCLVKYVFQQK